MPQRKPPARGAKCVPCVGCFERVMFAFQFTRHSSAARGTYKSDVLYAAVTVRVRALRGTRGAVRWICRAPGAHDYCSGSRVVGGCQPRRGVRKSRRQALRRVQRICAFFFFRCLLRAMRAYVFFAPDYQHITDGQHAHLRTDTTRHTSPHDIDRHNTTITTIVRVTLAVI